MRDDAITLVVCGASAAVLLPSYAMQLRATTESPIRVLLTHSAARFLHRRTASWFADEAYASDDGDLIPTELARRSRLLVVLPATAHTMAAVALGLAGSPAQTALLAATGPVLFFPSMNQTMWERPVVQRHVRTLRDDGHQVVEPVDGLVYENWQRRTVQAPCLPSPMDAAVLIAKAAAEIGVRS
ncbi:phosphopantothenate--cysteine ligase family flavoprotein [Actinoplanes sp. NPDC023801]|uniref:phosphopantothenate--cysteine ligase family flavoprotein n=1 Tax=Actinoplanes sp. NPDC023801 TaxID=3154595 RepID=UPI003410C81B